MSTDGSIFGGKPTTFACQTAVPQKDNQNAQMKQDSEEVMSSWLQFPKISTDGITLPMKANKNGLPDCGYTKRQPVSKKMVGQRRNYLTLAALTQKSAGAKQYNTTAKRSSLPGCGFQKCQMMVQHLAGKPRIFLARLQFHKKDNHSA